ncbi:MAG: hypothetical protein HON70_01525 [Lentisphaerae bacterium]|jgi:hypothetical protein|nr:hypothetical protein [Lentisphaerota bacterium]
MPDPTRNGPPPQPADTASAEPVTFGPGADAKGNPALMGSTRYNEPMVKQTPRPEPDPERERTKAILYAATFVLAAARRGDDIDEALAEMMVDRQWEKCGGPPQELDILRRAHELDPTNGPIAQEVELRSEAPDQPEVKQPPEPEADPDVLRALALWHATIAIRAAAKRGDSIEDSLTEILNKRNWRNCGEPPQELDILRRAHELDPTNGPISRAIHALELDAEWDTPLPSDGTGDQPKPDPPDPKPPAEPPLSLDALRAEAQEIVTWCVKAMMAADQVEAFRGRSAAIRAIIDR